MSIELPGWVVDAFYFVGLPWPGVDEDELRGWAKDLRAFADEITQISRLSHDAVQELSGSSESAFVRTMARRWDGHHAQITAMREPMHVFAAALEDAAVAVEVQKGVVIGAAVTLATAVIATQGEALVTFGLAEGEVPLEVAVAKTAIKFALQELEAKLLGMLVDKSAEEVSDHVGRSVAKLLTGGVGVAMEGYALKVDTQGLRRTAATVRTQAARRAPHRSDRHRQEPRQGRPDHRGQGPAARGGGAAHGRSGHRPPRGGHPQHQPPDERQLQPSRRPDHLR
ncbi:MULTISPECIES: WXG100-like domain-containing protein [Streptomycetaceae]|uniref:WXG100-like domain-containing protein n=1 Tax=Streptomycetaceae TaxID=2062 RepID=UPI000213D7BD|nr:MULTISPECIES: hypothetical protein [Streptomycetaceae]MYS59960.1 hypothetical protein [Streptomyces sp. SID5468]CCB75732.1 protein of unknown function [Streptantibioticus cattleyicolor NRRL 8057 = DSM 46488]